MTGDSQQHHTALLELWAACVQQSLEDATQAAYSSHVQEGGVASGSDADRETAMHFRFTCEGTREAELTFTLDKDTRLQIVQLLSGEPLDATAHFLPSHEARWQKWLQSIGTSWADEAGTELGTPLRLHSVTPSAHTAAAAAQQSWQLRSGISTVAFSVILSLVEEPARVAFHTAGEVEAPVHRTTDARRTADPPESADAANLDLLLDIELFATLRFGTREMQLREVLDLCSGDVVPLDRAVHAPVELVVGDRIVARGDVVVVDGNYGLRVGEIATPRQRLEGIRCLF